MLIRRRMLNTGSHLLYLYNLGDECTAITGGWVSKKYTGQYSSSSAASATKQPNSLYINLKYNIMTIDWVWWCTKNSINMNGFSKLCIDWKVQFVADSSRVADTIGAFLQAGNLNTSNPNLPYLWAYRKLNTEAMWTRTYDEIFSWNVADITPNSVLNFGGNTGYQQNIYITIRKVWLE